MNDITSLKSAKDRYPEWFEITDFVINTLHEWIHNTSIPAPTSALQVVLHASNIRAFNLYRSINNLLATDHWEDAAILARSMFELVLNLEEIQNEVGKEEEKARKYLRFHILQEFLHTKTLMEYNYQTGRYGEQEFSKLKRLEKSAKVIFKEFRAKKSISGWKKSWCGSSVRQLAKNSTNPMRLPHYKIIYSFFSEFSHSGPLPVMSQILIGDTPEETQKLMNGHESSEKEHMSMVMTLSTTWLLEILMRGQALIPEYDVKWNFTVLEIIYKLYGVKPPPINI